MSAQEKQGVLGRYQSRVTDMRKMSHAALTQENTLRAGSLWMRRRITAKMARIKLAIKVVNKRPTETK
jgi:hypothetical protein